jgi:hypothetical protein
VQHTRDSQYKRPPLFLLGIGRDNASLQSVYWKDDESEYQNQIDWIKKYMTQGSSPEPQLKEVNIWNDRKWYMEFLDTIDDMIGLDQEYHEDIYRLLPRDSEHVLPTNTPTRFVFAVDCHWILRVLRPDLSSTIENLRIKEHPFRK